MYRTYRDSCIFRSEHQLHHFQPSQPQLLTLLTRIYFFSFDSTTGRSLDTNNPVFRKYKVIKEMKCVDKWCWKDVLNSIYRTKSYCHYLLEKKLFNITSKWRHFKWIFNTQSEFNWLWDAPWDLITLRRAFLRGGCLVIMAETPDDPEVHYWWCVLKHKTNLTLYIFFQNQESRHSQYSEVLHTESSEQSVLCYLTLNMLLWCLTLTTALSSTGRC